MLQWTRVFVFLQLLRNIAAFQRTGTCAELCFCDLRDGLFITNCSGLNLQNPPFGLSPQTNYLDLTRNRIRAINDYALEPAKNLTILDTRLNPGLEWIDIFPSLRKLKLIYTDYGKTCCAFNSHWMSIYRNETLVECRPTTPALECQDVLINIPTLVLFLTVIIGAIIMNPWLIIVILCTEKRRHDPFNLCTVNYAITNLMITFYVLTLFIAGIVYYGNYASHMYNWRQNPICGFIGFMLITATLLQTFFYTLLVIIIYQKVRYSLDVEKHLTNKHMLLGTIICWVLSLLIASVPFIFERRYNQVGSCLPFYAQPYANFRYVILYTVIVAICNITNVTLAMILLQSLAHAIKVAPHRCQSEHEQRMIEENLSVKRTIIGHTVASVVLETITIAFLVMSCMGDTYGKIGRDWFTRVVALKAVLLPIAGPMRKKGFYSDTVRLFQKWNCYDWEEKRVTFIHLRRRQANQTRSEKKGESSSDS